MAQERVGASRRLKYGISTSPTTTSATYSMISPKVSRTDIGSPAFMTVCRRCKSDAAFSTIGRGTVTLWFSDWLDTG
ncbi:hypothetical protein EVAR_59275_1 [Eumeta japonica]|uniref:Uncharacterized protein n=1 Tax=Eumeta variegata TaxID=151549 RepID=A0A4C1YJM0_EUMVA|nr:hypothetical protein EVAR_59275_1 [Eumeta japonica]